MTAVPPAPEAAPPVPRKAAKAALLAAVALAVLIFVSIVIASVRRAHDIGGILTGVFTGLFTALLFAAVAAWGLIWLVTPKAADAPLDMAKASELERLLAPTLAGLETARTDIVQKVHMRMVTRLPLGVAAGVGLWVFSQVGRNPGTLFNLLELMAFGGAIGWYWASRQLSEQYRRLYKQRVLPQLAAQFGSLSYRTAIAPDMTLLRAQHVFREFDRVICEDEIFGVYRGMALNIVELKLTHGAGKETRVEFNGLMTQVELPRNLSGVTAVVADNRMLGNLEDRFASQGRAVVRVEDPVFEKIYKVYGTDQVAARALLTPAFMERFLTLGERAGYMRPLALAQGNRLMIALPTLGGVNLFEPPSYSQPAASRKVLLSLYGDIQAVLRAADTVIDLDQFSRTASAEPAPT
jgi:hypothetical protein